MKQYKCYSSARYTGGQTLLKYSKQEAMDLAEIDQSLANELYEEFKKEKQE